MFHRVKLASNIWIFAPDLFHLLCQLLRPILIFPATLRPPPGLSRPRPCRAPPASAGLPAETRPPAPTVSVSRPGRLAVGPTPVDSLVVPRRHDHAGELKLNCVKSEFFFNPSVHCRHSSPFCRERRERKRGGREGEGGGRERGEI